MMEKIELKMRPSFSQCLKSQWVGYWLYKSTHIYAALTVCFILVLAILLTEFFQYRLVIVLALVFVLGMWTSSFIRLFTGAFGIRKIVAQETEKSVTYLDANGAGYQNDSSSGFLSWQDFWSFWETRNYFFLQYKTGGMNVIFKTLLTDETISFVRKTLEAAPVKEKHLRSNK